MLPNLFLKRLEERVTIKVLVYHQDAFNSQISFIGFTVVTLSPGSQRTVIRLLKTSLKWLTVAMPY